MDCAKFKDGEFVVFRLPGDGGWDYGTGKIVESSIVVETDPPFRGYLIDVWFSTGLIAEDVDENDGIVSVRECEIIERGVPREIR